MRKLLFYLLLLPLFSAAQYGGGLQAYQVRAASYGATQWSLLSLPDDYTSTAENYPLIIFLHGYGEVGSTEADLKKLITQGLPSVISKGTKIQAVSPLDNKLTKFIVLCPQHHGWTTPAENIEYILSDFPKNYRVDTNRIYITGLSAGGQGVIQAVTYKQSLTNQIAGIIPMSPSAPDLAVLKKFTFFSEKKPGAWFFSGNTDPGNYTANAFRYSDSIYKYNGGKSRVTLYSGGHCCWVDIYNPAYKVGGLSIYEWMLSQVKNAVSAPPVIVPPVDTAVKYIQILHDPARVFKIIVVDKDGTVTSIDSVSTTSGGVKLITR